MAVILMNTRFTQVRKGVDRLTPATRPHDTTRSVLPAQHVAAIRSSNPCPRSSNIVPVNPQHDNTITKLQGQGPGQSKVSDMALRQSAAQGNNTRHFSLQPPKLNRQGPCCQNLIVEVSCPTWIGTRSAPAFYPAKHIISRLTYATFSCREYSRGSGAERSYCCYDEGLPVSAAAFPVGRRGCRQAGRARQQAGNGVVCWRVQKS